MSKNVSKVIEVTKDGITNVGAEPNCLELCLHDLGKYYVYDFNIESWDLDRTVRTFSFFVTTERSTRSTTVRKDFEQENKERFVRVIIYKLNKPFEESEMTALMGSGSIVSLSDVVVLEELDPPLMHGFPIIRNSQ